MERPIEIIHDAIQKELDLIYEEIAVIYDDHNMVVIPYEQGFTSLADKPKYHLITRRRKTTISLIWTEIIFYQRAGRWRRHHDHIKIGRDLKHNMRSFKKAAQWEFDLICETEEKLHKVRKRLERLKKISAEIRNYLMMYDALDTENNSFSE